MKKILLSIAVVMCILFSREDTGVSAAGVQQPYMNSLEPFTVLEMTAGQKAAAEREVLHCPDSADVENGDVRSGDVQSGDVQWQAYGSKYFYNQLDKAEQEWWDTLDALGMRYLTGTESLTENDAYTMADGYVMEYFLTPSVSYTGITPERAREILYMFRYSNPQYYFFQTMVYSSVQPDGESGMYRLSMYPAFADGTARAEITAQLGEKIAAWVEIVDAGNTALEKEKAAFDLICQSTSYDQQHQDIERRNAYAQSIYSVFFTENTVCAGYAQTMQLLMNAVGIDCAAVTSTEHEWNIIRLNDTWYNVDVTWGDLDKEDTPLRYTYFNRSEQEFLGKDTQTISSHTALDYWKAYLPELTYDSGADFTSVGTIYTPVTRLQTPLIRISKGMAEITAEAGAKIYYTVDTHAPTVASVKAGIYRTAFAVKAGQKIQAIAVKNANWDSEMAVCNVKEVTCTVQFYSHSGSKAEVQEVEEGGMAQEPPTPVWNSYQFCGWYTDAACQHAYDFHTPVTEDMVLYAKWMRGKFTVRFYANGGTDVANQYVEECKKADKPANPIRDGYTFAGWYTDASLTKKYNFATPVFADVNLYAKWQGWTYPLKLDANGGYIGKKSVNFQIQNVENGDFYRNLSDAKRRGYRFLGWYTEKNGGTKVVNGDKIFLTKAEILYAQWEKILLPKAVISSAKSKAPGKMEIKIKKRTNISGCQIRYSFHSSMKSAKTVNCSTTVKEISKLKKGKICYVQVRLYQQDSVGKKPVYGAWSNKKAVRIKK